MIFYRAVDGEGLVHWETRADFAKKIDPNFTEHDIGNQKPDIHALLNDSEKSMHELRRQIDVLKNVINSSHEEDHITGSNEIDVGALRTVLQEDAPHAIAKEEFSASVQVTADIVMDWLLDGAKPSEIENIFSGLGARFHEMRKAAKQLD